MTKVDFKTIEQEWDSLIVQIFPKEDPQPHWSQLWEMKKAFFAGYFACIALLKDIGEGDVPDEEAAEFLEQRAKEALDFSAQQLVDHMYGSRDATQREDD